MQPYVTADTESTWSHATRVHAGAAQPIGRVESSRLWEARRGWGALIEARCRVTAGRVTEGGGDVGGGGGGSSSSGGSGNGNGDAGGSNGSGDNDGGGRRSEVQRRRRRTEEGELCENLRGPDGIGPNTWPVRSGRAPRRLRVALLLLPSSSPPPLPFALAAVAALALAAAPAPVAVAVAIAVAVAAVAAAAVLAPVAVVIAADITTAFGDACGNGALLRLDQRALPALSLSQACYGAYLSRRVRALLEIDHSPPYLDFARHQVTPPLIHARKLSHCLADRELLRWHKVCIHILGKSFLISLSTSILIPYSLLTLTRPRQRRDDVRGGGRRPRHDNLSASTETSALLELIVADGRHVVDRTVTTDLPGISCCDPNDQHVDSRRRHAARRFKRRAATLVDAHTDDGPVPVKAPRTTSRNDDGTHSFPPTAMFTTLCQTTPRSPPLVVIAVVPCMRPARESQAWETGEIVLGTTVRTARSRGKELRLSLAMSTKPGHRYRREFPSSSTSRYAVSFCDPEPPEARVRTPRAKDAEGKGPFTLTRDFGLISIFLQIPSLRSRTRGS
ncbi:hypothetical protein EV121DRAFT_274400 [Schizophyllum commune]